MSALVVARGWCPRFLLPCVTTLAPFSVRRPRPRTAAAVTRPTAFFSTTATSALDSAASNGTAFDSTSSKEDTGDVSGPLALIFDTETTGRASFDRLPSDPSQPDLVQLGALLVDTATWRVHSSLSTCVQLREGVAIEPGAEETHRISSRQCQRLGISPNIAAGLFYDLYQRANILVAHNLAFDACVMEAALHRSDLQRNEDNKKNDLLVGNSQQGFDALISVGSGDQKQRVCTMQACTDILKIPGRFGKYKWPSLGESYQFVTDKDLEGSHDALVDSKACLQVFQYLVEKEHVSLIEIDESKSNSSPPSIEEKAAIEISASDSPETVNAKGAMKTINSSQTSCNGVTITKNNRGFAVTGETYKIKEELKKHGGRWDWKYKEWKFSDMKKLSLVKDFTGIENVLHKR